MTIWKDKNGVLHDDDNGAALHLIPDGCTIASQSEIDAVRNPPLTPEQTKAALEAALDAYIDSVARAKGYDSRITAALRAGYVNPWQAEGVAFGQWMDACYAKALAIQKEVEDGQRPIPTAEELIAEMPVMVWPE